MLCATCFRLLALFHCVFEKPRAAAVAAYDFETFTKSATDAVLYTSDRSLPVSFTVKTTVVGAGAVDNLAVRYDVFAMADCILYISLDGKLSTRIYKSH